MTEENKVNPTNNPGAVPPPPTPPVPEQPVQATQPVPAAAVPPPGQIPPTQQMPPQSQVQGAYPPPGQVPPPQPYQPYYGQPPVAPSSNGKAIAALIFGILAILTSPTVFFGVVFGIVAIILGVIAVKKPAKDSKANAGKVCGILGIVFSIFLLIIYILAAGFFLNFADRVLPSYSSSNSQSIIDSSSDAADEEEIIAQSEVAYESMKNPSAELRATLVADYNEEFREVFGFTMLEAGIDPSEVVQVTIDSISYGTPSAYVCSGGKKGTSSTSVYSLDVWTIIYDTTSEVKERSDAGEVFNVSTAEGKTKVGDIFKNVMATADSQPYYSGFELDKVNGSWKIEEDSFEEEVEYIFGTY